MSQDYFHVSYKFELLIVNFVIASYIVVEELTKFVLQKSTSV